jgi:quercetin dioxygenase-like cupin family protein
MGKVRFDADAEHLVSAGYSQGRGPVLRSNQLEVTRIFFAEGESAEMHAHDEEQFMYVLTGRVRITMEDDSYELGPGEATFNPSGRLHALHALQDTQGLSVKVLVSPSYEATGRLA